jgi:hypothetical protein
LLRTSAGKGRNIAARPFWFFHLLVAARTPARRLGDLLQPLVTSFGCLGAVFPLLHQRGGLCARDCEILRRGGFGLTDFIGLFALRCVILRKIVANGPFGYAKRAPKLAV